MDMSSLSHSKWECKYHIVFASKFRRKVIYGQLKKDMQVRMIPDEQLNINYGFNEKSLSCQRCRME